MEGTLGALWSGPGLNPGSTELRPRCSGLCPAGSWNPPKTENSQPPWVPVPKLSYPLQVVLKPSARISKTFAAFWSEGWRLPLKKWSLQRVQLITAKGNPVVTGNSNMKSHLLLLLWIICLTEGQMAPVSERHLSSQFWKEPRNISVKLELLKVGREFFAFVPLIFHPLGNCSLHRQNCFKYLKNDTPYKTHFTQSTSIHVLQKGNYLSTPWLTLRPKVPRSYTDLICVFRNAALLWESKE